MNRPLLSFIAALACGATALASGSKQQFLISFHGEGDEVEGERHVEMHVINGEKHWFRKNPLITQMNFKAYWPFPAADGKTWGAVFWLDHGGQHQLQVIGAMRGQYLAAAVNRNAVDIQVIDRVPNDGRIVIWKNLPPELFAMIDKQKKIRRIGEKVTGPPPLAGGGGRTGDLPAGAPLPEGAVVGRVDPAALDAATADMDLEKKKPVPKPSKKPAKKEDDGDFPPFQPDAKPEKVDITPLPEPSRNN